MWNRLTSLAKFLIITIVLGLVIGGYYYFKPAVSGKAEQSKSDNRISSIFGGSDDELTVIVNTWGGFAPLAYLTNGSLTPDENSIIYKQYGIKLNIKICDIFEDSRNVFKNTENAIVYCTTDALPVEMGAGSAMASLDVVQFAQVDWSRGGDMIVVNKGINNVAGLKNKTIAVAMGTASNTFLIKTLESNGLTLKDVVIKTVTDGIEAKNLFIAGAVDAAVIWTPDDGDCLKSINGSKVLIGTETAAYVIADGLLGKKSFVENNKELLTKFVTAWLTANGEINNSDETKKIAAAAFAKAFNVNVDFAMNGINKVRLTTLGDNQNFFGLNSQYLGITGEQLYSKMAITYSELNLTNKPLAWRSVSNTSIIEAISNEIPNQEAEAFATFKPATEEQKTKSAISNKKVTITFPTASYTLSDESKSIIDKEFVGIAKTFGNARIRIEGNTDAVGNNASNKTLSLKRAQAVADYLSSEYRFDRDRFITIGNGSKKAQADGVVGDSEYYRMTEFQLITE